MPNLDTISLKANKLRRPLNASSNIISGSAPIVRLRINARRGDASKRSADMFQSKLEVAERNVRQGERHVIKQRELVEVLRHRRQPTDRAERLLMNLEQLLQMHRQHLTALRSEQQRQADRQR